MEGLKKHKNAQRAHVITSIERNDRERIGYALGKTLEGRWLGPDLYFFRKREGEGGRGRQVGNFLGPKVFLTFMLCMIFFFGGHYYTMACARVFLSETRDMDNRKHSLDFFPLRPPYFFQ